jgi:hypothetical protein
VERERESLDAIELNLRTVLATRAGHRPAAGTPGEGAGEAGRGARAAHPDGRHLGSAVEPTESDQHADVSAGMAAEAEAIAELLAASDMLLHDLD